MLPNRVTIYKPHFINQRNLEAQRSKGWWLLFLLLLCKLALAFYLDLGNDEAYYWLYSQQLQWNYFDHPPMVAVWIRIFTANLLFEGHGGFLRLGSVVGSALAGWFLYRTVSLLHSERAGWLAMALYHVSFYAGITAGLYILPDSPQMVFWTASMWMMARLLRNSGGWRDWMLFGVLSGLCILSKVHGVFLWGGMGGYALFRRRDWLRKPQLYLALLVTLVLISPIIFWNVNYDFITYKFHSNRVTVHHFVILWKSFLREAGSQLTFNNPVNVVMIIAGLVAVFRKRLHRYGELYIYCFTGLPLALVLLVISLFRDTTLPHWSGPAYVSLLPLAAIWLAQRTSVVWPRLLRWSGGLFAVIVLSWTMVIHFYPGTWGSKNESRLGFGDMTLDMYGWKEAGEQFQNFYRQEVKNGRTAPVTPLVASHWWGAHVDYYFARPLNIPLIGLGKPQQLNEYLWANERNIKRADPNTAYCIMPSDDLSGIPSLYYRQVRCVDTIRINRNGRPAHSFFVYRMEGLLLPVPLTDGLFTSTLQ